MSEATQHDLDVLKEIRGEHQPHLIWGAAMSEALEYLQGAGYATRGTRPQITDKGRELLGWPINK